MSAIVENDPNQTLYANALAGMWGINAGIEGALSEVNGNLVPPQMTPVSPQRTCAARGFAYTPCSRSDDAPPRLFASAAGPNAAPWETFRYYEPGHVGKCVTGSPHLKDFYGVRGEIGRSVEHKLGGKVETDPIVINVALVAASELHKGPEKKMIPLAETTNRAIKECGWPVRGDSKKAGEKLRFSPNAALKKCLVENGMLGTSNVPSGVPEAVLDDVTKQFAGTRKSRARVDGEVEKAFTRAMEGKRNSSELAEPGLRQMQRAVARCGQPISSSPSTELSKEVTYEFTSEVGKCLREHTLLTHPQYQESGVTDTVSRLASERLPGQGPKVRGGVNIGAGFMVADMRAGEDGFNRSPIQVKMAGIDPFLLDAVVNKALRDCGKMGGINSQHQKKCRFPKASPLQVCLASHLRLDGTLWTMEKGAPAHVQREVLAQLAGKTASLAEVASQVEDAVLKVRLDHPNVPVHWTAVDFATSQVMECGECDE